jgi:hypothetical protein
MLINEKINKISNVVVKDQLLSLVITIHLPKNIDEGGNPPKLILNLIDLGQARVLFKTPDSFFRNSDIIIVTDK